MSSPPEKDKDKEKDAKENPPKESADPEPPKVKIEEKKSTNEIAKDSKEEEEKKMKRTQRFGMLEKKGSNLIMSSQEEMDKRKERFKEQIKEEEEKEKEKEKDKDERERSRDKNNKRYNGGYRGGQQHEIHLWRRYRSWWPAHRLWTVRLVTVAISGLAGSHEKGREEVGLYGACENRTGDEPRCADDAAGGVYGDAGPRHARHPFPSAGRDHAVARQAMSGAARD